MVPFKGAADVLGGTASSRLPAHLVQENQKYKILVKSWYF